MRVAFFGTPEFAVPSLRALLGEGFDVVAVVTQPPRAQGRSRSRLIPSPVKVAAQAEGLDVLEPEQPSDPPFLARLRTAEPDVGVVVAYGHILKPELLELPERGMVNVHPSLLPALRGAAPVEWAILNGLETTGVTIMRMEASLDAGPILLQIEEPIEPDETGGELAARLAELGAEALIDALALWEQGKLTPKAQDHTRATYAPKLTRDSARLDWTKPATIVARTIRALDPKPGAWTELERGSGHGPQGSGGEGGEGGETKLFGASVVKAAGPPGEVLTADSRLLIACSEGAVAILEVQPAGKPRMTAADWLRGRGARVGQRFR